MPARQVGKSSKKDAKQPDVQLVDDKKKGGGEF